MKVSRLKARARDHCIYNAYIVSPEYRDFPQWIGLKLMSAFISSNEVCVHLRL